MSLLTRLALALTLTFAVAAPALAFEPAEKEEIGKIVREYLLQHPEVLYEAQKEWNRRQEAKVAESRAIALKDFMARLDKTSPHAVLGDPKGDVTLVEFFDYNCSYCRHAVKDIDTLVASDPKLRVVLVELPVIRAESLGAAQVSIAVGRTAPDKFRTFHDKLLAGQTLATKARALAVAKEVGVDQAKLDVALEAPEIQSTLLESKKLADDLGVEATPTFVVGDQIVPNTTDIVEDLQGRISALRTCGKAVC